MRNVSDKSCRENQNTRFMFIIIIIIIGSTALGGH
jgi:hypothetical protein